MFLVQRTRGRGDSYPASHSSALTPVRAFNLKSMAAPAYVPHTSNTLSLPNVLSTVSFKLCEFKKCSLDKGQYFPIQIEKYQFSPPRVKTVLCPTGRPLIPLPSLPSLIKLCKAENVKPLSHQTIYKNKAKENTY